jgi:hypothetical protein
MHAQTSHDRRVSADDRERNRAANANERICANDHLHSARRFPKRFPRRLRAHGPLLAPGCDCAGEVAANGWRATRAAACRASTRTGKRLHRQATAPGWLMQVGPRAAIPVRPPFHADVASTPRM